MEIKEEKYLVLKLADIQKYILDSGDHVVLDSICAHIQEGRAKDGKPDYHYVVVNDNEPYAEQVWDLVLGTVKDK